MNHSGKLLTIPKRPDKVWTDRNHAFRGFGLVQTLWLLLVGNDSKTEAADDGGVNGCGPAPLGKPPTASIS